ncbi:MAG TPA: 50S ribosomal protein L29 [Bacteroidia bacterium]|jgi:large subunit ribosomal protein L29|nr:50S ribosomal protein L29 [Bacteroidia bacterium]
MAKDKDSGIKPLNDKELAERLKDERALYTKLKIQHAVSTIENPARITAQRKLIAQILTETKARSIKAASAK